MLKFENLVDEFLPEIEKNLLGSEDLSINWDTRPLKKAHKYHIIRQSVLSLKLYEVIKNRMEVKFKNKCFSGYKRLVECDDHNTVMAAYNEVNSGLFSYPFHSSTIKMNGNDDVFENKVNETSQTISSTGSSSISKLKTFLKQDTDFKQNDFIKKSTSYNDSTYMNDRNKPKNQTLYDKNYIYLPAGMNRSYGMRNSRHSIPSLKEGLFSNE